MGKGHQDHQHRARMLLLAPGLSRHTLFHRQLSATTDGTSAKGICDGSNSRIQGAKEPWGPSFLRGWRLEVEQTKMQPHGVEAPVYRPDGCNTAGVHQPTRIHSPLSTCQGWAAQTSSGRRFSGWPGTCISDPAAWRFPEPWI